FFLEFFPPEFIPALRAALIMPAIALAGTGCAPGVREGGGDLPLRVRYPEDLRARDRPAVPGRWVTDAVPEKRAQGQRLRRGSRGEAARVLTSARLRPPRNWVQPGSPEPECPADRRDRLRRGALQAPLI